MADCDIGKCCANCFCNKKIWAVIVATIILATVIVMVVVLKYTKLSSLISMCESCAPCAPMAVESNPVASS